MKISVTKMLQEDKGNKSWHYVPTNERVPEKLTETVYFPCLNQFEDYPTAERAFRRIRRTIDYARQKNPELKGILGLSSHKHWTPCRYESSTKGGRPKRIFNQAVRYRTAPHIHLFLFGQGSRTLTEKIARRELGDSFTKSKIQTYDGFPRQYVIQQSDNYREWQ